MTLGSEDFSASVGMEPTPQALFAPNQQIRLGRQLGFVGAFCIHPSQVEPMNQEFSPSASEIEDAHVLIGAFEDAEKGGRGAIEHFGKMVDLPVVNRARELLRRVPRSDPKELS